MTGSLFTIVELHDLPENSLLATKIWVKAGTAKFEGASPELPIDSVPNTLNNIFVALNTSKYMT